LFSSIDSLQVLACVSRGVSDLFYFVLPQAFFWLLLLRLNVSRFIYLGFILHVFVHLALIIKKHVIATP